MPNILSTKAVRNFLVIVTAIVAVYDLGLVTTYFNVLLIFLVESL